MAAAAAFVDGVGDARAHADVPLAALEALELAGRFTAPAKLMGAVSIGDGGDPDRGCAREVVSEAGGERRGAGVGAAPGARAVDG